MTYIDSVVALREEQQSVAEDVISAAIRAQVSSSLLQIRDGVAVWVDPKPLEEATRRVATQVFRASFSLSMDTFAPSVKAAFIVGEDDLLRYLQAVGMAKVRVINETTRRMLLEEVLLGLEEGLDNYGIAQRLYDRWIAGGRDPSDGPVTRFRTEVIARTEIAAASNAGGLSGAQQAGMTHKVWASIRDSRTRDGHDGRRYDHFSNYDEETGLGANGQIRLIHEPFVISGEQLMFPGDTGLGASVGNVAMCRCAMTYKFKR